jgi:hypothetical protein
MESTTPTATPARRTTIWSTCESANRKSASQEEDVLIFFLFSGNSKHLRIHDYIFRVGNPWGYHLNNPFSFFLKGFPFLGVPSPWFLIIGLSSNSRRCSHKHKKIASYSAISCSEQVYFFFFLVILRCQIHRYFNCLLSSSFSFMSIYIIKKPKRQQLTDRIYR